MTPTIQALADGLSEAVKRAVLMAPFNSKGCGIRGGELSNYLGGNERMGGIPKLFVRRHNPRNCSGDYSLTTLGLSVRRLLQEREGR